MLVLSIRTDKPDAEIGLFQDGERLDYQTWLAHRKLSATILAHIRDLLAANGKTLQDIRGIAVFKGPGSFTGLRIGMTVANTLAYSLDAAVVACRNDDDRDEDDWLQKALAALESDKNERMVLPYYDKGANITIQKH